MLDPAALLSVLFLFMAPQASPRLFHYIGQAAPAKILFQFARRDQFITPWDAEVYVQAASEPKEARWYDTGHFLNEEARRERVGWVVRAVGGELR